ncbi:MAG: energy-coupling factor ABC transporter permease [Burkholderiales bacterium]|nr:energy-coupling factor ABC transporter permease [Burkholderiales bacterium]
MSMLIKITTSASSAYSGAPSVRRDALTGAMMVIQTVSTILTPMGIFYTPLSSGMSILSTLLAVALLIRSAAGIPWQKLQAPTVFSTWCAGIIVLVLLWRMRVQVNADLHLHLMGVALFALMFGRPLATLGIGLAIFAYTAEYDGQWGNLGVNVLLLAIVPAWISERVLRLTQTYLPHHMFVYLFGNGFFGSLLVNGGAGLLALASHALLSPQRAIPGDAIAYMLLLAWGEAFLVGFLVTIFAVYRPAWLFTFDDAFYLQGK